MKILSQSVFNLIIYFILLLIDNYIINVKYICMGITSASLILFGMIFKDYYELHTRRNIKD